jgi:hypothetical protein
MLDSAAQHDFHFDAVQMPLNVMDAHFRSFEDQVLPVLLKREIGVEAMKTFGDEYILRSKTVQPIEALHYSIVCRHRWSSPVSTIYRFSTRRSKPLVRSNPWEPKRLPLYSVGREKRRLKVNVNSIKPVNISTARPTTLSGSAKEIT